MALVSDAERKAVYELERRSPEKHAVDEQTAAVEWWVVVPMMVVGVIVVLGVMWSVGGWHAMLLGAVLIGAYGVIGWGLEPAVAWLRRREHEQFSQQARKELGIGDEEDGA